MLIRDFYPLIRDLSQENQISLSSLLSSHEIRLATLSAEHQESVEEKVELKLQAHQKKWLQLQNIPGLVEKMRNKMREIQKTEDKDPNTFTLVVSCPACGNDSILFCQVDYDNEPIPTGVFVSGLLCKFCKFEVWNEDYEEMEYLGLNDLLYRSFEDEDGYS